MGETNMMMRRRIMMRIMMIIMIIMVMIMMMIRRRRRRMVLCFVEGSCFQNGPIVDYFHDVFFLGPQTRLYQSCSAKNLRCDLNMPT